MVGMNDKGKYLEHNMKFGFIRKEKDGMELQECVFCFKVSSNESLKPAKLNLHLEKCHSSLL